MEIAIFIIMIVLLVLLILLRVPVVYALGLCSLTAYGIFVLAVPGRYFQVGLIAQRVVGGANSFTILAIPLFLFAGRVMNSGGITSRIFNFSGILVGQLKGGLAHVNVVASLIFSGMSGAAVADVAGLGSIEIKAMTDAGFDGPFSCAITGASSVIGPIIPPSIPMVAYSVLAGVSTGRLFMGGVIPGIIMAIMLMIMASIISRKRDYPVGEVMELKEKAKVAFKAIFPLMAPIIIIGGIWTGLFTPTEAACVASLYAIIISVIAYRTLPIKELWAVTKSVAIDSAAIIILLAFASFYSVVLGMLRIPQAITSFLTMYSISYITFMIIMTVFYLIIGCFLSVMVNINLFTPILAPIAINFGIDPVFFGVFTVLTLMIGTITPPFGMVLFALSKVSNEAPEAIVREILPFIGALILTVLILVLFPSLVTFIPNLIGKNL